MRDLDSLAVGVDLNLEANPKSFGFFWSVSVQFHQNTCYETGKT
jgi:hypothetical protein